MAENKGQLDVAFAHTPGDRVETDLGDRGLVDTCSYSKAGKTYYVLTAGGNAAWYREENLSAYWTSSG